MRLRLVHTLSLLLLAAVLLVVIAMGGLSAWTLRNGFSDYLIARDVERLEQFAAYVAPLVEQAGGLEAMRVGGVDMRELLDGFAQQQGIRRLPPPPRDRTLDAEPGRPPPRAMEAFGERISIMHPGGEVLWGRSLVGRGALVDRPIRVGGEVVAFARMVALSPVPNDVDAKFLNTQYGSIASVAAALLLLAVFSAWWIASRWTQPLRAVQEATRRIAQGEFSFRLHEDRSDEIGDVMRNVNAMAQGLGQLEGARRKWIADMSHELRTPLTVLRGETEALVDGIRPTTAGAMLSLRDEVLSLVALVDDLHSLAMSDLNALPCSFETVDAMALARKVVGRFELRATQAGLTLQLKVPTDVCLPVCWDARRIEQLLGNLLDNSLRYTDTPGRIVVTMAIQKNEVSIEVADTAPGVASADLDRLFEPLYRADAARSRRNGGSGLGLSICSAIVQAHCGSIQATSSALGGVSMRVVMPIEHKESP